MSEIYNISHTWKEFSTIRRLVIFGDSYSSVDIHQSKVGPDANNPLGIPFPGVTWNEPDRPNWVGHLITKYCPEPRYRPNEAALYGCPVGDEEAQATWTKSPLLVHDYAKGGDRVPGVKYQIRDLFLPGVGKKPAWAAWTECETLFVTWVGINDCAYLNIESVQDVVDSLLSVQQDLYDAGARNFLFIDLPTIHRTPAVTSNMEAVVVKKFQIWNKALRSGAQQFAKDHPDTTVLLFSSFEAFDTILNKPEAHGFDPGDLKRSGGSIWMDNIHPTSKVHDHLAHYLTAFLETVHPTSKGNNK